MSFPGPLSLKPYLLVGEGRPFAKLLEGHGLRCSLCWDVNGTGWLPIIDRLIRELRADGWDGEIVNVVDNVIGHFDFDVLNPSPRYAELLDAARREALRTCQSCGSNAEPTSAGPGLHTLCVNCQITSAGS